MDDLVKRLRRYSEPQESTKVKDPLDVAAREAAARIEALEAEVARYREAQNQAAADVLAERARQVSAEGWSADHDDAHFDGAIARAAASYALASAGYLHLGAEIWPWDAKWLKSTNQRRDLVKAGALIIAEIERLDRAALSTAPVGES